MKIEISPEKIMVPDNAVEGQKGFEVVTHYFDRFMYGKRKPSPSFVLGRQHLDLKSLRKNLSSNSEPEELEDFLENLEGIPQDNYFGVERFHRMVGATLATGTVPAIELATDFDLERLRRDVIRGRVNDFDHPEKSLGKLAFSAVSYYFHSRDGLFYDALYLTDMLVQEAKENRKYGQELFPKRVLDQWKTMRKRFKHYL